MEERVNAPAKGINPLPDDKNFDWSKLKQIADDILTFSQAICPGFLTCLQYKSFKNLVGKGEIARKEQFLLFPSCFLPI